MIVGYFRLGARKYGKNGAFANVWQADKANVGNGLKLQLNFSFKRFLPGLGEARRLPGRRSEAAVASSAASAVQHYLLPAGGVKVGCNSAGFNVPYNRAYGNLYDKILAVFAARPACAALFAVFSPVEAGELEVEQRIHVAVRNENDAAASAAVSAVRAAARNEFFPVEAGAAVPAVARLYDYSCFVNELHRFSPFSLVYLCAPCNMA